MTEDRSHSTSAHTADGKREVYKRFDDFPDGRVLEFTKDEWDDFIQRLYNDLISVGPDGMKQLEQELRDWTEQVSARIAKDKGHSASKEFESC